MIVEAIPGVAVPWGTGIGEGVPILFLQKSHIINLLMLIYLTDRQPVPVYHWLCPMYATTV